MIQDCYNNFAKCASTIKGFKLGSKKDVPYDITELANSYIQAENDDDELKKSQYISALMIRYWHMIPLLYEQSKTLKISYEDMVEWLYEALEKAFKYKSWLNKDKTISEDPRGAEKCINQCITSTKQWWFKHLNQDKRKINTITDSLDIVVCPNDNHYISLLDTQVSKDNLNKDCDSIVCSLIDKGKIFDALIIDGILNQNTFIQNNTNTKYKFSKTKLMSHLKTLSPCFIDNFSFQYTVDKKLLEQEILKINSYKPYKLRSKINKAFNSLKYNKEVLSLCM